MSLPQSNQNRLATTVRWIGTVTPERDETNTFYTVSNDGVRLWVNEQLIIENSRDHKRTENQGTIALKAGEKATIRMEIYDAGRDAVAQLIWSSASREKAIAPGSRLSPPNRSGSGLKAEYFADRKMKNLLLTRTDPEIDFDWSKRSPFATSDRATPAQLKLDLPAGNYRAEWTDPKIGTVTRGKTFRHAGGEKLIESPAFQEELTLFAPAIVFLSLLIFHFIT